MSGQAGFGMHAFRLRVQSLVFCDSRVSKGTVEALIIASSFLNELCSTAVRFELMFPISTKLRFLGSCRSYTLHS